MKIKFRKYDNIVSISDIGELKPYKVYKINYIYISNDNDINFSLDGLLWVYHSKNFITMVEYRKLKFNKIGNRYDRR